jgi:hypothetical protein
MAKKIKHPYILDTTYQVYENGQFDELENVIVKIYEYTDKAEEEQLDLDERKDYLEIRMKRIIPSREINDVLDIADSDSAELLHAIAPILKEGHEEFIASALKIDDYILLDKYIYIDTIEKHGDFLEQSIPAAISRALTVITKGLEPEDWVAVMYEAHTISEQNNEVDMKRNKVGSILKNLGFLALPEVVSNVEKEHNVLNIVGGNTLNKNLEYSPELLEEKKKDKKIKP